MKIKVVILIVVTVTVVAFACNSNSKKKVNQKMVVSKDSLIKRGEYLVQIIGCGDCHSPKQMGVHGPEPVPGLELSGYRSKLETPSVSMDAFNKGWVLMNNDLTAAAGPWGISFAANITSDTTGIGTWSEAQFKKAMMQGKFKGIDGARDLLPPMPWPNFRNMKDEDISAIYAYLKSTRPVKNVVPAPLPPARFSK